MNILYLIDELIGRAGTENHLLSLSIGMAGVGHKVFVFSLMDGPFSTNFKAREDAGIKYRCLSVKRIYGLRGLAAIRTLISCIREKRIDVIQSFHTGSDLIAPISAKLSYTRVAAISSRRDLGFTKSLWHVFLQRFLNRAVDAVIANSQAVRQSVIDQENYPARLVEIIYNGIDLRPFWQEYEIPVPLKPIYGRSKCPIIIGNTGNIKILKGHAFLIDAAAILCKKHDNLFFAIAGDGPLKVSMIEKCRKFGIADRFHFLGNITEVPAFLRHIHIYVQPSESEGFSNSIVEAMATGCPIVATNIGGNTDAIENGKEGYLVEFNDVPGFADKIECLIKDKELRSRLGRNGILKAKAHFSLESMVGNYDSICRKVLQIKVNRQTEIHSLQNG